ncbi:cytochrome P450 [Penicillium malachiteum]|uniref:cytochrome P450 n=1 Tax=Penicillium malachiteum TaxID=1324776 RepID=UPI002546DCBF|nr:cytochrome P450 [Penicillium malachiteum]KAJ5720785.1 cytochrome P450 [Penicillium malachiteum]
MFPLLHILVTSVAIWVTWCLASLINNLSQARATGLKYVILPCSLLGAPWLLSQSVFLPLLGALPHPWTVNWLPLLIFNDAWHNGYEPFERVGVDTFLAVSPGGIILYTCDADVSSQLFRDGRFGKPAHLMQILNIFGPTMTGTDGAESRLYRRIAAPFFNEATLRQVFSHSVEGGRELQLVLRQDTAYRQLRTLAARVSLHLLNRVCNQNQTSEDLVRALRFKEKPTGTHRMTYTDAVHTLLNHYETVFLFPPGLLKLSPSHAHRKAAMAYIEMDQYMQELVRREQVKPRPSSTEQKTLLDRLVEAALPFSTESNGAILNKDQLFGNVWLFMFAGHEANANTLTFIIILLASHPNIQRALQADIDSIIGDTPSDQWSYDLHYKHLMSGYVGAVINEALRLFTVLPVLPKYVAPSGPPIPITVQGQSHPLPPGTVAFVNTSATHRHPKYWPRKSESAKAALGDPKKRPFGMSDFDPERWLNLNERESQIDSQNLDSFLNPYPGTFVPFSEGSRACLGYRFALVELCAVVVSLFKESSVRLLTRNEEVRNGTSEEVADSWEAARDRAELALSEGVKFDMSLRVTQSVPIKFEPRV